METANNVEDSSEPADSQTSEEITQNEEAK